MSNGVEPGNAEGHWKIFDHLLDAVFIVDRQRRLYYANESFLHLCDASRTSVAAHEDAGIFIELPEECWSILSADPAQIGELCTYREVGFISKSGTMGRAQVYADILKVDTLAKEDLFFVILRDVTVEARLHAKYKVQIEHNERLIGELRRSLAETAFMRQLANELPIYADTFSILTMISTRLKNELGFRDAHFFHLPEESAHELEPIGIDKRMGSRLREVVRFLGPALRNRKSTEMVSSIVFKPFGLFWVALVRPRLEAPFVLVASAKYGAEDIDQTILLEALSGQVATLLDNRSLYFASITDPVSGLFNKRFFDSRFGIECQRSSEKRSPLSLMLVEIDGLKKIEDAHGVAASEAILTAVGQKVKKRIRGSDIAARVGYSEIALALPETNSEDAFIVAESLRKQIEEAKVLLPNHSQELKVTISCGISGFKWTTDDQQSTYRAASEALAKAKASGCNQSTSAA